MRTQPLQQMRKRLSRHRGFTRALVLLVLIAPSCALACVGHGIVGEDAAAEHHVLPAASAEAAGVEECHGEQPPKAQHHSVVPSIEAGSHAACCDVVLVTPPDGFQDVAPIAIVDDPGLLAIGVAPQAREVPLPPWVDPQRSTSRARLLLTLAFLE